MTTKTLSLVAASLLFTTSSFAEETLQDITVVTTNKTAQTIKNTTSNVTVITHEDIEDNGYQTVSQAISRTSGIIVSQSGGLGQLTSVFTRGMNGGQTLILLDGMRLNDPSTPNGAALLETFSTANIEQIEIIKGGASSIWGSNASAGVINIITKNAKNGLHGSAKIGYGTYNTKNADVQLAYRNDDFNAQVQASKLKTDGISALAPRSAEADGYENKNYTIKLGYNFDKNNKLSFSYNDIKTDTQFDASTADDIDVAGYSKQKNYKLNYTYTYENYTAIFYASKSDITRRYASLSDSSIFLSLNEAVSKEYSLINEYIYNNNKAVLGFEYKDIDGLFSYTSISSFGTSKNLTTAQYKNKAVFFSNLYHLNEKTLFETNIRYDNFDKFANKTTYKIGVKHQDSFIEGINTSANYYTSYDAPSIFQLSAISPTIPSLKPMYTKGFDISAGYKDLFTVTYFNNTVDDAYENIGTFSAPAYINQTGKEKFSGIEIESNYTFTELSLNLSANYTRLFKYEDEVNNKLIRRPKETLNISLDHYTDNDTHIGINAQYIGDRKDSDFSTFPASEVSTGNYTVWNLDFGTKVMDNINVTIHAKNIFNKAYQSVYGYATQGRAIYMNLKYTF
jgi:vitamin B12 transporter